MASGWTNRGIFRKNDGWLRRVAASLPAHFYIALITQASVPTADTNTFSELTEIPAGNGYTAGGYQITPGATDIDTMVQDNSLDLAYAQLKDIVWNAVGGSLPASGTGARYAVLLNDDAVIANREVLAWFDLGANRQVSDGQPLTLQNIDLREGH